MQKTVYKFVEKHNCWKAHKDRRLKLQLCLPAGSKRVSSVVIGTGANQTGLLADVWDIPQCFPLWQKETLVASQEGCSPLTQTFTNVNIIGNSSTHEDCY